MTEFDDVEIRRPPAAAEPSRRPRHTGRWIAIALLLAAAAAAAYILIGWRRPAAPGQVAVATTEQAVVPPSGGTTAVSLPPLEQMDPIVRQLVGALSAHPKLVAWLATDGLLHNVVEVVDAIAARRSPATLLPVLAPAQPFAVQGRPAGLTIDPQSFSRYDAAVDAFASIDPARAAEVYATLRPRLEEAYRQRFVGGAFHDRLREAMAVLAATPDPPESIAVVPLGVGYRYARAEFEALPGAQKHLLRTGPRNVGIAKAQLRELARSLGF
jgi:hypothetical protein